MWEVEMTTVSQSQAATTRNAGDRLAVGQQNKSAGTHGIPANPTHGVDY